MDSATESLPPLCVVKDQSVLWVSLTAEEVTVYFVAKGGGGGGGK